jgi:hypothetical protein
MSEPESLLWRKSTRSAGNGNCVEIAHLASGVAVRDSKDPDGAVLRFCAEGWQQFLAAIRTGDLDSSTT